MKMEIKSVPQLVGPDYWSVTFLGPPTYFPKREGALLHANKIWKRYYKEQAAFSMLQTISLNFLNAVDFEFITKMKRTKCAGLSTREYGYLKGIHERQQRDW